ncbi:carboxypeptidase-like regulatory domain-containing protein [Leptobacterium flavescens]|uniref:Carboxypeptidase-like regulatory domain-containing protein n=1 Tax=Leptobacterium flavescens TaxID=472055 RepID=A0A6P0UNZ3_9FLAO|nr:carboxypeptidase-like regulatory domain-containing protein [Leptobacterium flavescens]NER13648.1 carboxypeptidase-like regulatory domain-containing protein [Leptobacterium flavescens]
MEKSYFTPFGKTLVFSLFLLIFLGSHQRVGASDLIPPSVQQDSVQHKSFKGYIEDSSSGKSLVFATLTVEGTNISTITNTEGEFTLKVPRNMLNKNLVVSFLGYKKKIIPISELNGKKNRIALEASVIELSGVNVTMPKSAKDLVKDVFDNRARNYLKDPTIMTAFYRETIKKRRRNVSLSEAVVNIYKQAYSGAGRDVMKLFKVRKSTDYRRLDTLALKLRGGPFNPLYADVIKYPEYIFTEDLIDDYDFSFGPSTRINDRLVYIVEFKQRGDIVEPRFYGRLFIDADTHALTSAIYNLNVENQQLASQIFVRKKPRNVTVYPTEAAYRVDYRERNGKWYYGYSNVQLSFKVNWKSKLFNSIYHLTSEMAVTDWEQNLTGKVIRLRERLRPSTFITDEAVGFSDPDFWGEYNVIEPEKSIESAINKIRRQLRRARNN